MIEPPPPLPLVDPGLASLTYDQLAQLVNVVSPDVFYLRANAFDQASARLEQVQDDLARETRNMWEAWQGRIAESFDGVVGKVSGFITNLLQATTSPGDGAALRQAGDTLTQAQRRLSDLQARGQTGDAKAALQIVQDLSAAYEEVGLSLTPLPESPFPGPAQGNLPAVPVAAPGNGTPLVMASPVIGVPATAVGYLPPGVVGAPLRQGHALDQPASSQQHGQASSQRHGEVNLQRHGQARSQPRGQVNLLPQGQVNQEHHGQASSEHDGQRPATGQLAGHRVAPQETAHGNRPGWLSPEHSGVPATQALGRRGDEHVDRGTAEHHREPANPAVPVAGVLGRVHHAAASKARNEPRKQKETAERKHAAEPANSVPVATHGEAEPANSVPVATEARPVPDRPAVEVAGAPAPAAPGAITAHAAGPTATSVPTVTSGPGPVVPPTPAPEAQVQAAVAPSVPAVAIAHHAGPAPIVPATGHTAGDVSAPTVVQPGQTFDAGLGGAPTGGAQPGPSHAVPPVGPLTGGLDASVPATAPMAGQAGGGHSGAAPVAAGGGGAMAPMMGGAHGHQDQQKARDPGAFIGSDPDVWDSQDGVPMAVGRVPPPAEVPETPEGTDAELLGTSDIAPLQPMLGRSRGRKD